MACAFCKEQHRVALVEFDLDGKLVKKRAEFCRAIPAWIVKFDFMMDSRAGTIMLQPNQVKIISEPDEKK